MIVVDESIAQPDFSESIRQWYPGRVCTIRDLRPRTIIKDEIILSLLAQQRQPTFVTTNVQDFWMKAQADRRFCILCFAFPDERLPELPNLLRRLLKLPDFKTKAARCGKVARVTHHAVQFYEVNNKTEQKITL